MGLASVVTLHNFGGSFVLWVSDPIPGMFPRLAYYWWTIFVAVGVEVAVLATVSSRLPTRSFARWAVLAVAAVAAAAGGTYLSERWLAPTRWDPFSLRFGYAVLAVLLAGTCEFRWRVRTARDALHAALLDSARAEAELALGRAQLLRAQIEPHFLFNTLANIRRLLDVEPATGRIMLGHLRRYLQDGLPQLRAETSTLGRELESARAYLALHESRMGPRLAIEIDVPPGLGDREIPTMMLLTLVENALQHGLYPSPAGGTVVIRAEDGPGGSLRLSVADDGCGLSPGSGSGKGLANIRARLAALYRGDATLTLMANEPRGVVAMLQIPAARA